MLPPKLYSGTAADAVSDAIALATQQYTPGWTGASDPHDPGHALIVLAARMIELLAERVNRVPEKNLLGFLDFAGIERASGLPAEAPLTFLLSNLAGSGQQIPERTAAATAQSEGADARVFETRNSFFATASKLVHVVNVLPSHDLYARLHDLPPAADALPKSASDAIGILSAGGTGVLPVPHELYLASASLFGRADPTDVRLDFTIVNNTPDVLAVFSNQHLAWERFDAATKQWVPIGGVTYPAGPASASVLFSGFAGTGKSTVGGREDWWIAGRLKTAPRLLSALPIVSAVVAAVATAQAPNIAPDGAFFNSTPLDFSRPAFPFGDRPRYGDALLIGSARAFGPDIASATLKVTLRLYTTAEVQAMYKAAETTTTAIDWEYLSPDGSWKPVPGVPRTTHKISATVAGTVVTITQLGATGAAATAEEQNRTLFGVIGGANATIDVALTPPPDAAVAKVGGVSARWVRAVLRSQSPYGRDAVVTVPAAGAAPTVAPPTFVPPVIEKLEIAYTYKTSSLPIDRVVTANNFEMTASAPPAAGQTLAPFVALAGYAPGGAAGFLGSAPTLYLGFDRGFDPGFISTLLAFVEPRDTAALMPEADKPHVVWEYLADGAAWKPLDVRDGTADLSSTGVVAFQSPPDAVPLVLFPELPDSSGQVPRASLYWYRARLVSGSYNAPPKLWAVLPNTVMADNRQTVNGDWILASGSGEPNQRAIILRQPVLAGDVWVREDEVPAEADLNELVDELKARAIESGENDLPTADDVVDKRLTGTPDQQVWVRWLRVPNFRMSGARSRHYTLEAPTGVVTFGNNGGGLIPPVGKDNIVVRGLAAGGGEDANRLATPLAIKELKTSLPFIDKVFNVSAAVGGTNFWTLDQTFRLGPQAVKNRGRAVTVEDYEWITLERFGQVARAKALATKAPAPDGTLAFRAGAVSVIVVPKGAERTPMPPKGLLRRIEAYLGTRAFGAIAVGDADNIFALPPAYKEVAIAASVHPRHADEASLVARRVVSALEAFFHPLTGGEQQQGWPFGRTVYISEVFAVIERTEGVDHVVAASFVDRPSQPEFPMDENVLVASGSHRITLV